MKKKKKTDIKPKGYVGSFLKGIGFSDDNIDRWTRYVNGYLKENKPKLRAEANYKKRCIDIYEKEE